MSKERARRRARRESEQAARAAERAQQEAARVRRRRRRERVARFIPSLPRTSRSTGVLAAKRRRRHGLIALLFFTVQFLTWAATPDWGLRAGVLVVSLFATPVLAVLTSS